MSVTKLKTKINAPLPQTTSSMNIEENAIHLKGLSYVLCAYKLSRLNQRSTNPNLLFLIFFPTLLPPRGLLTGCAQTLQTFSSSPGTQEHMPKRLGSSVNSKPASRMSLTQASNIVYASNDDIGCVDCSYSPGSDDGSLERKM